MFLKDCVLCGSIKLRNSSFVAMWEPFPVNIGHMKIMSVRHDATLLTLNEKEKLEFFDILEQTINYLDTSLGSHKPDGYNLGVNMGEAAGQTLEHMHLHVIPRYKGDVENPRGGVRNIKEAIVKW